MNSRNRHAGDYAPAALICDSLVLVSCNSSVACPTFVKKVAPACVSKVGRLGLGLTTSSSMRLSESARVLTGMAFDADGLTSLDNTSPTHSNSGETTPSIAVAAKKFGSMAAATGFAECMFSAFSGSHAEKL